MIMATDAAWCRKRLAAVQRRLKKRQSVDELLAQILVRFDTSLKKV